MALETKIRFHFFSSPSSFLVSSLDTLFHRFPAARAMGACCAGLPTVKPEDIVPDPTEPSTFFLSKQSLLSSNYKVRVRCPVSIGLHKPSAPNLWPKHGAAFLGALNPQRNSHHILLTRTTALKRAPS